MADINVERKRGPGIWPWIIGLIILALILWWLFARGGDDRMQDINAIDTTVVATDTGGAMMGMPADTMAGAGMSGMPMDTAAGGGMQMDSAGMHGDTTL